MFVTLRHFEGSDGVETTVDPALVHESAVEAGSTASALDTLLQNLMDELQPLSAAWIGAGGTAFQRVRANAEEAMGVLNDRLHFLSEEVELTSRDYANASDELEAMMERAGVDGEVIDDITGSLEPRSS